MKKIYRPKGIDKEVLLGKTVCWLLQSYFPSGMAGL